ncbi:MAG: DUF5989 family protein [Planctomycetota bacterium]
MGKFLRENWIWILAPIVIVAVLCVIVAWLSSEDATAPFIYNF